MCLTIKEKSKIQTAKKDIVVYKRVNAVASQLNKLVESFDGKDFECKIRGTATRGKISVSFGHIYFCTNAKRLDGSRCVNRLGYKYSWVLDGHVDMRTLRIEGVTFAERAVSAIADFITPYYHFRMEVGHSYESAIQRIGATVEEAIHSYAFEKDCRRTINGISSFAMTCVIPKGSKYYVGEFGGKKSYASSALKCVSVRHCSAV